MLFNHIYVPRKVTFKANNLNILIFNIPLHLNCIVFEDVRFGVVMKGIRWLTDKKTVFLQLDLFYHGPAKSSAFHFFIISGFWFKVV